MRLTPRSAVPALVVALGVALAAPPFDASAAPRGAGGVDPTSLRIVSSTVVLDSGGTYHVVGRMQNVGSEPVDDAGVTAEQDDAAGNPLITASVYTLQTVVNPGETAVFDGPTQRASGAVSVELTGAFGGDGLSFALRDPLRVAVSADSTAGGVRTLTGTIANTSAAPLADVAAVLAFATGGKDSGAVLTPSAASLAGGASTPFSVTVPAYVPAAASVAGTVAQTSTPGPDYVPPSDAPTDPGTPGPGTAPPAPPVPADPGQPASPISPGRTGPGDPAPPARAISTTPGKTGAVVSSYRNHDFCYGSYDYLLAYRQLQRAKSPAAALRALSFLRANLVAVANGDPHAIDRGHERSLARVVVNLYDAARRRHWSVRTIDQKLTAQHVLLNAVNRHLTLTYAGTCVR